MWGEEVELKKDKMLKAKKAYLEILIKDELSELCDKIVFYNNEFCINELKKEMQKQLNKYFKD